MINILLILIGVILFGFIIFIHEFGHFFTAKLSGVFVKEFSIGMGPKLFKKQGKETLYTLRLFPIGGFCDMEGESDESESPRSFNSKPVWKRMIIVITGAVLNIILGICLMSVVLCQEELLPTMTISQFGENSQTESYGFEVGDTILEVDGYAIYSTKDLSFAYAMADPNDVDMKINRNGEVIEFNDMKLATTSTNGAEMIALDFYVYGEETTFLNVIKQSFVDSYSILRMVLESLKGLVTGQVGLKEIAGPVGATQAIGQAAAAGLEYGGLMAAINNIIFMMAVLTINLGVFNLLPFPALDGGRFFMLLIELITKKKIPAKYENMINTIGFAILITFMVVVAFSDVFKLFTA